MSKDLANEIAKALAEYSSEIEDEVDFIAEDVASEAVDELKVTSPKRYGKYARNWRFKKNAKGSYVVHNAAPTYRLTHLLENSHLLRNGGRSKAQPHIKPVEEKVKENFEKRIKELGR
ncbi:HK97 gp10 family phage protein [Streptococcus suis]|uniref:Prophage pi2 protein 37 n=2 Tax=Streptococcus suis TaxID=1307 RepID=A0A123TPN3_STRSU|nr:HK97 gp10 family phage protein [Streptococcus suis]NQG84729.1 HK97 gp10 family phage protein [Streptococcus suis]CYV52145.1 prophage pi2 protein 37 [Streptococcus suis]